MLEAKRLAGIGGRGWARRAPDRRTPKAPARLSNEIVAALEPELRRFVRRKVRPEAVDDVLQEVWLAASLASIDFRNRAMVRTWIYGVCLHKCHDQYRRQLGTTRFVSLDDVQLVDPAPSPEAKVTDSAEVDGLLQALSQSQREVLELYYYAQLNLAEIAAVLGRNLNTVKYQFYRAHAALLAAGEAGETR